MASFCCLNVDMSNRLTALNKCKSRKQQFEHLVNHQKLINHLMKKKKSTKKMLERKQCQINVGNFSFPLEFLFFLLFAPSHQDCTGSIPGDKYAVPDLPISNDSTRIYCIKGMMQAVRNYENMMNSTIHPSLIALSLCKFFLCSFHSRLSLAS